MQRLQLVFCALSQSGDTSAEYTPQHLTADGSNMCPSVLTGRRRVTPRVSAPAAAPALRLSFGMLGFPFSGGLGAGALTGYRSKRNKRSMQRVRSSRP